MFFDRFLVRLGLVLAPFLAPKLIPNRLKIASRRFLGPFFFKNADFHADLRFPRFFHQNRPQDEAKIRLRSPQDGSKTVLKSFFFDVEICLRFWSVLGSVLVAFGPPLGSEVGAQFGQYFLNQNDFVQRNGHGLQQYQFTYKMFAANHRTATGPRGVLVPQQHRHATKDTMNEFVWTNDGFHFIQLISCHGWQRNRR